ncbi:unnamed protein product [Larinioides sclopetarius]|uniref:Cytochrome P450 n=1 Tax=Larinioides sclopetarius TaxID=280406 RepID=A0AAV2BKM8_9ARAC
MLLFLYALSALITIIFLRYSLRRRKYSQLMPGTKHLFCNILGDLTAFDFRKAIHHQVLDVITKKWKLFPKEQLVCAWLSYVPFVSIVRANAVKEVLKNNRMNGKSFQYEWMKPLFGSGLVVSSGGKWKSRRKLFNHCFHPDIVRSYLKTFNSNSQKLVNILKEEAEKDFVYIADLLTLCAFDSICEAIFGIGVGALENNNIEISNSIKRFESIFMVRVYSVLLWPDFIFRNTKIGKDFEHHVNVVQEFTYKMIEETKKMYLSGERKFSNGKRKALIDVLLEKHLKTKEFTEKDVREEVNTFIAAGHETIGIAAMWAIYLIGRHPEVQAKLHEEIDHVFGNDRERPVTERDLKDLQYMNCVLKESGRIYPTVPSFARHVPEDTKICGYTVPKDTTCFIVTYLLHRDEEVFPDPEKFDPDRFSVENRVNIPEFAYIPFSGGARNCIGYKFAEMELGTLICSILRNFTVESLNKVFPVVDLSLHSSEPIRIKIRPRTVYESPS